METFQAFAEDFINRKSIVDRWKASTVKSYRDRLKQYLLPSLEKKSLSEINVRDYDRIVACMYERGLSTRRVNCAISLLNLIMNNAFQCGLIDRDIKYEAKNINRDADHDDSEGIINETDAFTVEEIDQLLSVVQEPYRAFFALMSYTGCRPCELSALRWDSINFQTKTITIKAARVYNIEDKTKTNNRRTLPMLPPARDILLELNEKRKDYGQHVFVDMSGLPIQAGVKLWRVWQKALGDAGIRPRPLYNLRHSFAINALRGGVPLPAVSRLLGHASVQTTIQHYLRRPAIEKSDIELLKGVFSDA